MTILSQLPVLLRIAARTERLRLPLWILSLSFVMYMWAVSEVALYPTEAEREGQARMFADNVGARAIDGPVAGTSIGSITLTEAFGTMAVLVALVNTFLVVRHTRRIEESGRADLMGPGRTIQSGNLVAVLVLAMVANVALAATMAGAMVLASLPTGGSLTAGAAYGGIGLTFAAFTALLAQLMPTARSVNATAGLSVAVAFGVRAVGDAAGGPTDDGTVVQSAWPSWLSPIGWGQQMQAFHRDRWAIMAIFVLFAAAVTALALHLASRRELGLGLLPARQGVSRAAGSLLSPLGLAWRLQRGAFFGWAVSMAVVGAGFGAIGADAELIAGNSAELDRMLSSLSGATMVEAWFATQMGIAGAAAAAGFTVHALLRMRAEEAGGRLDSVLAAAVPRSRWMAGHVLCAVTGTAALLVVIGLSAGLAYGAVHGDLFAELGAIMSAALVQLPATLVLAGLVIVVFALVRWRTAAICWIGLGLAVLLGRLGEVMELPQALLNLSPFTHVPPAPAADITLAPIAALTAVAVSLATVGLLVFQRRDVAANRSASRRTRAT